MGFLKSIEKHNKEILKNRNSVNKKYPRPIVKDFTIGDGMNMSGEKATELYNAILEKRLNKYEEEFSIIDIASGHSSQTYSALVLNGYLEKIKPNVFKINMNGFVNAYAGYIKLYQNAKENVENYLNQMESFNTKGLFSSMSWYRKDQEENISYAKNLIAFYNEVLIKLNNNFEIIKKEILK